MKKQLLIISDGNGVDKDFKKWPFFLKLLLSSTHEITNKSVFGISNDLMLYQLTELGKNFDQVIIQWSVPGRVDVVLDEFWAQQAAADSLYALNTTNTANRTWWCSSASRNEHIKQYHDRFLPPWLAGHRTEMCILAAAEFCRQNNIEYLFSLCYNFEFSPGMAQILHQYPWAWHQPNAGFSDYRYVSKYQDYDTGLSQPHSLVGLDWINRVLNPACNFIDYSQQTFYNIEQALLKQCSK